MTQAWHFRMRGLVQGVGFRFTMQRKASALGLDGWVRNRSDGSVEAVASGEESALLLLREWAAHGPRTACVEALEVSPWEGDCPEAGFAQKPTL